MKFVINREIIAMAVNKFASEHEFMGKEFRLMHHHWSVGKNEHFSYVKSIVRSKYNFAVKWDIRCFFVPVIYKNQAYLIFSVFEPPHFKESSFSDDVNSWTKNSMPDIPTIKKNTVSASKETLGKNNFDENSDDGKNLLEELKRIYDYKDLKYKFIYPLPYGGKNITIEPHPDGFEIEVQDKEYEEIQKEVVKQFTDLHVIRSSEPAPYVYCYYVFSNKKKDKTYQFYCPASVVEINKNRAERFRKRVIWREVNLQLVKTLDLPGKKYWLSKILKSSVKTKYRGPNYKGPN